MGRKVGRPLKHGVPQSERIDFRVTSDMKQQLQLASQVSSAGTAAGFLQGIIEKVAPAVIALNEGRMSEVQFKSMVAEQVFILASPSPSPSPEPEEEDGENE